MNRRECKIGLTLMVISMVAFGVISPRDVYAHCDTLEGPVVKTARIALENKDISPLLKWVKAEDETTIREAFQKTLAVRKMGPEARDLADLYFFETLVRIHRAGEGAPYTGLKPGDHVDPAVALADKALRTGSADQLVKTLTAAVGKGIHKRFTRTMETQKHADENVAAGREFVEAYVVFTHYVEGLHAIVKGADNHHAEGRSAENHHGD